MKRNDQPQMKASRNRRRTGTPQEVGRRFGPRLLRLQHALAPAGFSRRPI
jgi:hypothetical protein